MKKMYETSMINRGGRNGEVEAPGGKMHMKIEPPSIHAEGTNPEQLFAAGYASCFNGAVQHILEEHQLQSDSEVKARVSLYQTVDGGFQIGVILEVSLPGIEKNQAETVVSEAHEFCPYSKATRGNIEVKVDLV